MCSWKQCGNINVAFCLLSKDFLLVICQSPFNLFQYLFFFFFLLISLFFFYFPSLPLSFSFVSLPFLLISCLAEAFARKQRDKVPPVVKKQFSVDKVTTNMRYLKADIGCIRMPNDILLIFDNAWRYWVNCVHADTFHEDLNLVTILLQNSCFPE